MKKQTLASHISEIRSRLFQCAIWLIATSSLGYLFRNQIEQLLLRPIHEPLFYSSPAGGFELALSVSFYVGLLLSLPAIIYHIVRFIEPALPQEQELPLIWYAMGAWVLAAMAIVFAYSVTIPMTLHFLNGFQTSQIRPLISTTNYMSFIISYLTDTMIAFQFPLIVLLVDHFSHLTLKQLMAWQRYVIAGSFIAAILITPVPDPVNQIMSALPVILLYQGVVVIVWLRSRRRGKQVVMVR